MKGKKAFTPDWFDEWPQYFFILLIVVGLIITWIVKNPTVTYAIIFFSGAIIGKSYYKQRGKQTMPLTILVVGFFIGMTWVSPTNWKLMLLLYITSGIGTYQLFKKRLLH